MLLFKYSIFSAHYLALKMDSDMREAYIRRFLRTSKIFEVKQSLSIFLQMSACPTVLSRVFVNVAICFKILFTLLLGNSHFLD